MCLLHKFIIHLEYKVEIDKEMQKVDTAIEYVIKEGWPTSKERLIACFGAEITNYNVTKLTDCLIKVCFLIFIN